MLLRVRHAQDLCPGFSLASESIATSDYVEPGLGLQADH